LDDLQKNVAEYEDFIKRFRLVPPEKARFNAYGVDRFLKTAQLCAEAGEKNPD